MLARLVLVKLELVVLSFCWGPVVSVIDHRSLAKCLLNGAGGLNIRIENCVSHADILENETDTPFASNYQSSFNKIKHPANDMTECSDDYIFIFSALCSTGFDVKESKIPSTTSLTFTGNISPTDAPV